MKYYKFYDRITTESKSPINLMETKIINGLQHE